MKYNLLTSSGMSIFFPSLRGQIQTKEYVKEIKDALPFIQNLEVKQFLSSYKDTVLQYGLLTQIGNAVASLLHDEVPENEINYEKVKEFFQNAIERNKHSIWENRIAPLINAYPGGEVAAIVWLDEIIAQQKADVVSKDNVTVTKVVGKNSDSYKIEIANTDKKIIDSVNLQLVAEATAALPNLESRFEGNVGPNLSEYGFRINEIKGVQDTTELNRDLNDPVEKLLNDYLKWYTVKNSVWNVEIKNEKVYALKDQNGTLHAAHVEFDKLGNAIVYAVYTKYYQNIPYDNDIYLIFSKDGEEYKLTKTAFSSKERPMLVSDLKKAFNDLQTVYRIEYLNYHLQFPLSNTKFNFSADIAKDIKLVKVDIDELNDIADIDGDGQKIRKRIVVKDMYNNSIDISDKVSDADDDTENFLYNIDVVDVLPVVYNGKAQGPKLEHNGKVLQEGVDYTLNWSYDFGECINVGICDVMLIGKGKYADWKNVRYTIIPNDIVPTVFLSNNSFIYTGKKQ